MTTTEIVTNGKNSGIWNTLAGLNPRFVHYLRATADAWHQESWAGTGAYYAVFVKTTA